MLQKIQKFFSQKGQGIVEYALILAFVVAIAAVALNGDSKLGSSIKGLFEKTAKQIDTSSSTTDTSTSTQGGSSSTTNPNP